jgi:hypothetical protein
MLMVARVAMMVERRICRCFYHRHQDMDLAFLKPRETKTSARGRFIPGDGVEELFFRIKPL